MWGTSQSQRYRDKGSLEAELNPSQWVNRMRLFKSYFHFIEYFLLKKSFQSRSDIFYTLQSVIWATEQYWKSFIHCKWKYTNLCDLILSPWNEVYLNSVLSTLLALHHTRPPMKIKRIWTSACVCAAAVAARFCWWCFYLAKSHCCTTVDRNTINVFMLETQQTAHNDCGNIKWVIATAMLMHLAVTDIALLLSHHCEYVLEWPNKYC